MSQNRLDSLRFGFFWLVVVVVVCIVSALISVRPVLRLSPDAVFAGR